MRQLLIFKYDKCCTFKNQFSKPIGGQGIKEDSMPKMTLFTLLRTISYKPQCYLPFWACSKAIERHVCETYESTEISKSLKAGELLFLIIHIAI